MTIIASVLTSVNVIVRYTISTLNKLSVNISIYYCTPGYSSLVAACLDHLGKSLCLANSTGSEV